MRWRQMVEFFDLGKRDVHLRTAGSLACGNQLGQPVQCLRAEHEINIWRTLYNFCTFLAGNTTSHTNEEAGLIFFQSPDSTQVVKYLLLGFFPHRAGIEKNDVSISRIVRFFHALGSVKHIGHLLRVILVHLTAEGFDIKFLGHYYFQLILKLNQLLIPKPFGNPLETANLPTLVRFIRYF
jgi:hypothetical protein